MTWTQINGDFRRRLPPASEDTAPSLFLTNDTQCFFLILSFRVKKEFEGVAAIPPTASAASEVVDGGVGGAAATAASGASGADAGAAAAAIPGSSQYEPRLGTIQDAEGGQQLQRELDAVAASTVKGLFQVLIIENFSRIAEICIIA